eukprot:46050-Eustigmatos_ZCMA.PRE.1
MPSWVCGAVRILDEPPEPHERHPHVLALTPTEMLDSLQYTVWCQLRRHVKLEVVEQRTEGH